MITFIHPTAFFWLLLAVPLVLFYLWRNRPRKVVVTTGAIWQKALPLIHPRRLWQPHRWWVSLVVQLAVLVLMVTALAEPCWRRPQRVAVVLDATASMSVTEADGQTRLSLAKEKLRELVENLGYNDAMALIVVGKDVQIACRTTNNRENLVKALETDVVPEKATGNASVEDAVSMAVSLVAAANGGVFDPKTNHVVLISDGCFARSESVLQNEQLHWIAVGSSVGNIELETLSAERRNAAKPEECDILAALRNHSNSEVTGKLTLRIGQEPPQVRDVKIPANERLVQQFHVVQPAKLDIHAEFTAADPKQDALAEDNTATLEVPEAFCYHVTLVSPEENPLLAQAIQAIPGVTLETRALAAGEDAPLIPAGTQKLANGVTCCDVSIYDRVLPKNPTLSGLRSVVIAPPESTVYWTRGETTTDYVLMPWLDGQRSGISTAGVGFIATHTLKPIRSERMTATPWIFSQSSLQTKQSDENFAKAVQSVAMTELVWGLAFPQASATLPKRLVLVSCDLTQSDWLLADDFPRFLQYSLDWLADTEATRQRLETGLEPMWNAPDGLRDCNLNVPKAPDVEFRLPGEDVVPMWLILAVLFTIALIVEWALYQRRWTE